MTRWKTTTAALMIAALALTGCAAASESASTDESGGTLTLVGFTAPDTMDPAGASWGNSSPFYQSVFDTLLLATPAGTIEPWLATGWEYNEDNTVLTLSLRDDVTFTDGSDLTADVVVKNLQRYKDGTSPNAGQFAAVEGFEALDDATVAIALEAPDPALLSYLTRDAGLVGSADSLDSPEVATTPVGSGPYVLDTDATVTGTTYVYTKNAEYWNPEVQHYDELVINVITDPTAALNALKAGEANGVKLVTNDDVAEVEAAGWTIESTELDVQGLLLFDRDGEMNPALGNVKVRQAINFAIDRDAMLETLQGGLGTVTTQMFPASSVGYDDGLDDYYTYDPERAKQLLAEAGYPDGFEMESMSISMLGASTFALIGQQLEDVGIRVSYVDTGIDQAIADMLAPKYPGVFMSLEQNPDWQLINYMIAPTAAFNPLRSQDPRVDELIEQIQFGDESVAQEATGELNEWLVEHAWFAPFYRVQGSFATDPETTVEMLPTNIFPAIYDIQPKS
ncbi:peptide ABC transporter substrate-binding protein [Agromyces rhizosphaerae]|uniref:Peptide ABC transporter substrate-binding protein n=1 Tax=Agromyces rhizosphaerae TaxID=88374 RepID=A0A9W6CUB1_9MICO|nr:ABC transporter substrate-binding protein [Agromyces rhizosphaerae]GLI26959.1 peptide ABC transporter substrate-binding protein [Agromyces rhizosphaerae]